MPVVTLAEIDATGRKAARGHGCPWGLAEEAGKSVRWLASHGLSGPEALAALLANRAECCTKGGAPCTLRLGVAFADRAPLIDGEETIETGDENALLLLLAQVGRAADALDCAFTLRWEGGEAIVSRACLSINGATGAPSATCSAAAGPAKNGMPPSSAARPVEEGAWSALVSLSRHILVPTNDASRAGAGAGTPDTD